MGFGASVIKHIALEVQMFSRVGDGDPRGGSLQGRHPHEQLDTALGHLPDLGDVKPGLQVNHMLMDRGKLFGRQDRPDTNCRQGFVIGHFMESHCIFSRIEKAPVSPVHALSCHESDGVLKHASAMRC